MNYWFEMFKIMFYLLVVVGLIYFLSIFLKKNILKIHSSKYLNIVDRLYVSSKMSLVLVEVNDEIILMSYSDDGIKKIEKWDTEDFDFAYNPQADEESAEQLNFKEIFKNYWRSNDSDTKE